MAKKEKNSVEFHVGDTVKWWSQAAGSGVIKAGRVVAVIAAGSRPDSDTVPGAGWQRDHTSYVVRVGAVRDYNGARAIKTPKNYWPRAASLRPWSGLLAGVKIKAA